MARTEKARSYAIDDQAPGGSTNIVTTRERTINGSLPPDWTAVGNLENLTVGNRYGNERVVLGSALMAAEGR